MLYKSIISIGRINKTKFIYKDKQNTGVVYMIFLQIHKTKTNDYEYVYALITSIFQQVVYICVFFLPYLTPFISLSEKFFFSLENKEREIFLSLIIAFFFLRKKEARFNLIILQYISPYTLQLKYDA